MSWNLVAVSSFSICSFESFLENPRKLNEQIQNEATENILGEDSQVFLFLSLVSIVSALSFLTNLLRCEWVKGTDSTLIANLGSTYTLHAKDCTTVSVSSLPYCSKCQKLKPLYLSSLEDC